MQADVFSPHIESVARHFWGDPNPRLSNATELRWGSQGSRSVDIDKGTFFDHEANEGGGVLSLVTREARLKGADAVEFLRQTVGCDIPDDRPQRAVNGTAAHRKVVATYDYQDETGELLFQVVRYEPKDFRQRRPDPESPGGWSWSIKGVRQVPYRLPEVLEAMALDQYVTVVEGEKDADALWSLGVPATCNAGGAGKWPESFGEILRGADLVILPDNDDAGRNHADVVAAAAAAASCRVRTLDLPALPPKGDVSDWLRGGGTADQLHALIEARAVPWLPGAPKSRFGAVPWGRIDAVQTRHDWLVEDMMFCGDFGLNYGASQSGKSFLSCDMGLSIARGEPFLGKTTMRGGVIYQAGEGGLGLLGRLKAYRKYHGLEADDLPFVLLPGRVDLFGSDGDNTVEAFVAEVQAWRAWLREPLRLVVIDTWATATPGANENASEDVSRALRNIQLIQEASDAAVLVVHHKNAGGEKPRGHTSLYANADMALEVSRDEQDPARRTLRVAKVKDGEDGQKIEFNLQSVTIGAYDSGKPITSCVVVRPAEDGDPRTGQGNDLKALTSTRRLFLHCLDQATRDYGADLPPTVEGVLDNFARGVEWHHFMRTIGQSADPGKSDEALRKQIERDGNALLGLGLIGRDRPWVWLTEKGRRYR